MVVASAEQRLCACYKEQQEFHKVVDLKDAGLVIYCHSLCREGVTQDGVDGVVGAAVTTSQDVCVILHNTKDVKVTPAEIIPALEKHDISCPRCRKLFEHAQKLLQNVKSVDRQNAMGVCDRCLKKAQSKKPCDLCSETVKKFLSLKDEKKEEMKRYLKLWLSKMRHIVKDVVTEKTKRAKPRAHSELQIDRLCQSSPKAMRQPEVKQMFHSELHKSDSNLYVDVDLDEKEQRLRKSVLFNEAVDPFAVTPYEKGIVDTYRQGPSLAESDISFYGSEHDLQDSILRSKIEMRSQKQIIHEIPKIAPWEQEALEKKDDSLIVKEVTLKLKRDPGSRGVSPHDSSGVSDKGPSSIYLKVTPRKRHMPTPESDSEKSRSTDHGELGEPKRKKKMESATDIKGAKRKHMPGESEHPYSEQYKHEKEEFSKMNKKAHDTERLPKTLKRLEHGHLTDDEVKLQHKIPKLSHATEQPDKSLVMKTSIRRKKPKHEQDTVENILQKQFSYFFPKSMEKEAKKPHKIGAPSSQLIRTTHEKIRQQAEEEKKRHEQERQRKLEEKEKKRLEKEEKKKEAEELKKQAAVQKRLADEESRRRAAEEELIQKAMIEDEKKKSEDRARKDNLKKDLASKHDQKESLKKDFVTKLDQKEKKVEDSGKDLKQKVDAKGKAVKDQDKDLKTKPEIKAKATTKDKVEEPDKTKKDLKGKSDLKGKVEEMDKTQKDKSKPEATAKPATKDKVEATEKAKKDKTKAEPLGKPGPKDKETEKERTESKVRPESKGKTDSKDEDKAKKDEKVKSEAKPKTERPDVTESAKKDGKIKPEAKMKTERTDVTESAKKDKAKAEPKAKTDVKTRAGETESAKKDKVKTDIKDKDEEKLQKETDREEQRRKAREEREQSKQDRDEQAKKEREEREKSKEDREGQRKQEREEKEKSKQDRDEQAKKEREEREKSKQDRDEQRKQEREEKEKSKQARAEQDEKDREESDKSTQDREERRRQAREEREKSKLDQAEQGEREREEREKSQQDRDEQAQKAREEKEKSKEAEKLQKEKEAASKKKQDSKGESESSDKKGKESKEGKEKALDFKGMKVDKGELSEPAAMTKGIPAKAPDIAKVKEGPLKKEDKAKEKPKGQDKSSKVKEDKQAKEKSLDFKGIKVDKGEPAALAVSVGAGPKDIPKDISLKLPELPTLKEGPLIKEDKVKEKPSKTQDKVSKVSEEKEPKKDKKEKKEDTGESQFRKLQAERQKEKELLNKKQKQEEAELQKARDLAEKKAREDAEKAQIQIREAIATPRPEPPRPPPRPKLEPKRADEPAIEVKMNQVKVQNASVDDLILRLVTLKQTTIDLKTREKTYDIDPAMIKAHKCHHEIGSQNASSCELCKNSELEIDVDSYENQVNIKSDMEIIIGEKIFKYRAPLLKKDTNEIVPIYFQTKYEVAPVPITPETVPTIPETSELTKKPGKDAKGVEPEPGKGIIRYALSDRTFIDKGWTMLPTEKVVRKMNVYRMRPAHPEFDWFEHNKNKRLMTYDTGEKLAEFDDNGRGRWYYRNGRLALDYYDAEETNAQQRFVIYSSGEPDERGRSHPITILATFDYLGNGIVFDHAGKIRLKYNQTEGVVLDRGIGPVSHWKWHTLNDPPVLQQVMIDTQMAHKDPQIIKLGTAADNKIRPDNEEMLAIEFDNFIKEKSKKLSQKFKPFQIKMKALKINEHFSLKVLDQATVYLIFRDGSTNLKLNIGMILDHQEIVDTDTAEVGEVSNNLERFPARTDSLAGLQRSVAYAQRYERTRTERERRLRPAEPCESADQLTAAASPPLRPPLRTVPTGSTSSAANCRCRKPTNNLYYNTRLL